MIKTLVVLLTVLLLSSCGTESVNLSENTLNSNPEIVDNTDYTDESYAYICEMAKNDVRFKWIKAFIDKDIATCVDMIITHSKENWTERELGYSEWYECLNLIEFGDFSAGLEAFIDEYGNEREIVLFSFQIVRSDYELFPVGDYTYEVNFGAYAEVDWAKKDEQSSIEMDSEISALITRVLPHIWSSDSLIKDAGSTSTGVFSAALYRNECINGVSSSISEQDLKDGVEALFGIVEFAPPDYVAIKADGIYTPVNGGGFVVYNSISDVVNNDSFIDVYVQFYADPMNIVKSHYVKYTIEKTDNAFPYSFREIVILDEGEYEPLVWKA